MKKSLLVALNSLVIALLAPGANAAPFQQREVVSIPNDLALEVTSYKGNRPTYLPVPGPGSKPSATWTTRFRRSSSSRPAVVGIESKNTALPSYKVSLQNLSSQNVTALGIVVLLIGRKNLSSMPHDKEGQPLIKAGAAYELSALSAGLTLPTPEGFRPYSPQDQEIVITTAVFEDNSYEGDAETAARFRAYTIGRKLQIARLLTLFKTASDSADLNPSAALNKLKAQASSLDTDVETSALDQLLKDFPTLGPREREFLKTGIEVALNGVKTSLLKEIQEFEKLHPRSLDAQVFQMWLRVNKERYEKWLSRLS